MPGPRFPTRLRARLLTPLLGLVLAASLAGCDTAEERAQAHYERAKALLAEGQTEQAIVEFRNVFKLDGANKAARLDYATLMAERGETAEAIGQFLRLAEQDWGNVAIHKRIAELALTARDAATAATHADRAFELDPKDPEIRALKASTDYQAGRSEAAVAMAEGVIAEMPGNLTARMVLVAARLDADDAAGALSEADAGLALAPGDEGLHLVRLAVLERLGDRAAVGAELAAMAGLFPKNDGVTVALIQWHLAAGDIDAAEPLMRARAAAAAPGSPERVAADLALAQALLDIRGPEAARTELEALATAAATDPAAAGTDPVPYARVLASLDVSQGRTTEGIAALRAIVDGAAPSDARRETQVELARTLAATGDGAGADALVEAVLAEDPGQVEALKLRAERRIAADQPEAAIADLRTALNQEPRDSETLTLMAMAHERQGARELAGERLALAVEVSDAGPAESIRYARFLMQDDRVGPAEAVVAEALRRQPQNPDLLALSGQIDVSQRDWPGARQAAARLRALAGDEGQAPGNAPGQTPLPGSQAALRAAAAAQALAQATALEAQVLSGQNRFSEAIATLESISSGGGAGNGAGSGVTTGVAQAYVRAGDLDGARRYLETQAAADPDAPLPRLMLAGVAALAGDTAGAEAGYRGLIAADPGYAAAYEGLYQLLAGSGQAEAAATVLAEGLAATGDESRLLFLEAGRRELAGDIDGAIAAYDTLYARDSASPLVANNLASLLSSNRPDAASQERAYAIARRLRGTEVPHFQDTYGWIMLGRGEAEEALPYLEKAAAALPDQPLVLYHLGAAQARLGQTNAARATLEQALAAGEGQPFPQADAARALLAGEPADPAPGTDTVPAKP